MEESKLISLDLSLVSVEVIEVFLLDDTADSSLFDEIAQKNSHRPEILRYLLTHPKTPETTRQFVAQKLQVPVPEIAAQETTAEPHEEEETIKVYKTQSLLQRIQHMKVGEKMQLALRGSKDMRTILLRDANREVMLTVLENPKITESEIELIAKQRTTPDEILRTIAKKREWARNYSIAHALVTNPKTPTAIALKYVPMLRLKDLVAIEKNRNIPENIRVAVKKKITTIRHF